MAKIIISGILIGLTYLMISTINQSSDEQKAIIFYYKSIEIPLLNVKNELEKEGQCYKIDYKGKSTFIYDLIDNFKQDCVNDKTIAVTGDEIYLNLFNWNKKTINGRNYLIANEYKEPINPDYIDYTALLPRALHIENICAGLEFVQENEFNFDNKKEMFQYFDNYKVTNNSIDEKHSFGCYLENGNSHIYHIM